ncbi:hypothetical protein EDC52_102296 [Biostraticola tofi]|uniref:Uncharacterized protein n=1 Tax=Biostraticola tofi TaxID=466109 RepID=A0A4R3Z3U0_9GAMM|nr:hypothetical protein EDC52_102296 [Biostraticola tofi]
MVFNIHTPLTYVLIASFFYIRKHGFNNNIFYTLIFLPWLTNSCFLLWGNGVEFGNISEEEILSFSYSSLVSMFVGIIIYLTYRLIKKRN